MLRLVDIPAKEIQRATKERAARTSITWAEVWSYFCSRGISALGLYRATSASVRPFVFTNPPLLTKIRVDVSEEEVRAKDMVYVLGQEGQVSMLQSNPPRSPVLKATTEDSLPTPPSGGDILSGSYGAGKKEKIEKREAGDEMTEEKGAGEQSALSGKQEQVLAPASTSFQVEAPTPAANTTA